MTALENALDELAHISPTDTTEARLELATLCEAGEKMARALQSVLHDRPSAHTDNVWENVNAALAEWEAANK